MSGTSAPTYAPPEAFRLRESIDAQATGLRDDGTCDIIVIRPTVGRGKGRHLYTADMLRENAHKFAGWKMYNNHLSEAARRSLGGLPRPIEHQGGRVLESWWDSTVPASGRYDQGAVVARVKPVGFARQLIQEDPEIVEASINARATGVRQVTKDGVKCWLVEGIEDTGSIDWVSEGGAGGRVASLMEAYFQEEDDEMSRLSELSDDELLARLRRDRPALIEALIEDPNNGGGPVENTALDLREALATDEGQAALREVIQPLVEEQVEAKVEARMEEERAFIIAEARADSDRQIELRDLRDAAHELIEASTLPPSLKEATKARYTLTSDGPTDALDVYEQLADDGSVEQTAEAVLREAVEQDIQANLTALREAADPTRVVGQGGASTEGDKPPASRKPSKPLFARQLQEAGIALEDTPAERKLED